MTRRRAGFTLIESCAAAALLVAAISLSVALVTSLARQRQAASLHAQAVLSADNVLERLTSEPYEAITDERAAEVCRDARVAEMLPGGDVHVTVASESGSPPGKRIEVELVWQADGSGASRRHQVVTWVYRAERGP